MQVIQCMMMIVLGFLAMPTAKADSTDPLFQSQALLKVEITAPFSTLVRDRSETEYLPGVFSFEEADGTLVELDVQVRARGNFRHKNCDFPPLTLNFRRSQVEGTLLEQQNKLKMVNHCKITRQYEQAVLREYLVYRLLNSVTDLSFRVRLLQVTYVDSEERRGRVVRSAFLIEHKNRLAARIGKTEQELDRADISTVQPDHLNVASMFQYLIGNVDFSPIASSDNECCHNYSLYGNGDDSMVAIPYDFDLAGIVNAPYLEPDKELGVEQVGQRVYRGYCVNNGYVEDSISKFQKARDTFYALVADQTELEPSVRQNVSRYIDGFYEIVNDPQKVEHEIFGKCM